MTNKEAIKHFVILRGTMKHNYDFEADMRDCIEDNPIELFNIAIKALKKADKYKWHDLRKDPTDLPKTSGMYLACIEGFQCKYVTTYWAGYVWFGYEVSAWREIEPFEVE